MYDAFIDVRQLTATVSERRRVFSKYTIGCRANIAGYVASDKG